MKNRSGILWFAVLLALALAVWIFHGRIPFDWAMFWSQVRHVSWKFIVLAIALNWVTFWMRSVRWAMLLAPTKKIGLFSTLGSQFIGFTAVGLFGRLADLTRPYLIAKRVQLSLSSQIAVYTIERMFDLGAAAIIFSSALAFTPKDLPHHEVFVRTGLFSLAGTLFLAVFALVVRVAGGAVAAFARGVVGAVSKSAGASISQKIVDFRDGLNTLSSFRDFVVVLAISLVMWGLIGASYMETLHAFVDTPVLANIHFAQTMLLMGASIGGSVLQLPVVGWFTQIAVTTTAMRTFYGAPIESATACGALLLLVLSLSIIPVGLSFAQIERVSLKKAAEESGAEAAAEVPATVPDTE
jgi:uncharacterized membrane protein YbhN (UPF0104 family)